jgi:hypothetical protein
MPSKSLELPAFQALTIVADAVTTGSIVRVADVAGSGVQYGVESIAASSTTVIGPFSSPRRYLLTTDTGAFSVTIRDADATASSAGLAASLADETGTGKAMFNDSPVVETFLEVSPVESAPDASATGVRLYVIEVDGLKVLKARFAGGSATVATDPD